MRLYHHFTILFFHLICLIIIVIFLNQFLRVPKIFFCYLLATLNNFGFPIKYFPWYIVSPSHKILNKIIGIVIWIVLS